MTNPNNLSVLTGRLSTELQKYLQKNGDTVILTNVAVEDNFKSGPDNKIQTNFIPVRAYVPKSTGEGLGGWDRVGKGDQISLLASLSRKPYEKDGETVYPELTVSVDGFPQFLESATVTQARAAKKAVAASAATEVPADETPAQEIERLKAELAKASAPAGSYEDNGPFGN